MRKRSLRLTVGAVVAGTVTLVTACGSVPASTGVASEGLASTGLARAVASTGHTVAPSGSATATCAPVGGPGILSGPVGASFVSGSVGWLLVARISVCTGAGTVTLYKTTDGGLKWTKVAAPAAPWAGGQVTPQDGVTSVLFANAKDGWAYGPGLWATHNGGASWHQVAEHGYAVYSMAATGASVVAAFEQCGEAEAACDDAETFKVETAAVHTDSWRAVRGAAGKGGAWLTARAGVAYAYPVITSMSPTVVKLGLLTGPANGSKAWHPEAIPCPPGAIAASAVTANHVLLSCAFLGAHPATTHLYSSTDSGAKWKQFATLGLYDGASLIEQTPNGTLLVGGIYNGIELSRNGGRTWTSPAADTSLPVGGGAPIVAALTTNTDGYFIVAENALWITRDGGRTWTQVKAG